MQSFDPRTWALRYHDRRLISARAGGVISVRQLTRSLQRQLEDELDAEKNFGINPDDLNPNKLLSPRDDDAFSPAHDKDESDDKEGESVAKN